METDSGKKRIALVAGASGLVGREILRLLATDDRIAEVRALVRRPLPALQKGPRVREYITDFDHLQDKDHFFQVDLVFSALGTTIRQVRSQEGFRRVDFEYPLAIAKLALTNGARHLLLVSALSANAHSPFFYNRVKGELEEAILALGYPSVTIARPSLLLGQRDHPRLVEEITKHFAWLAPLPWRPVHAWQVAYALVRAAFQGKPGVEILTNSGLRKELPMIN